MMPADSFDEKERQIRAIIEKTYYVQNRQMIFCDCLDHFRALCYILQVLDGKYVEKEHEFECLICGDYSFKSEEELEEHKQRHYVDDAG